MYKIVVRGLLIGALAGGALALGAGPTEAGRCFRNGVEVPCLGPSHGSTPPDCTPEARARGQWWNCPDLPKPGATTPAAPPAGGSAGKSTQERPQTITRRDPAPAEGRPAFVVTPSGGGYLYVACSTWTFTREAYACV